MNDANSKRPKEGAESSSNEAIARAIRQLRNDLGLTQVQLAVEVGITPTTVYRYEAATNTPTNDILAKILQFAVAKQSLAAVQTLAEILADRTGLNVFGSETAGDSQFIRSLAGLRLERKILVMAALVMLQENADRTAIRVFASLVEPWTTKASKAFGPLDIGVNPRAAKRPEHEKESARHNEKSKEEP